MKPGDKIECSEMFSFECPFCEATVTCGEMKNGASLVSHPIPMCRQFEDNNADVYVKKCLDVIQYSTN